MSALRLSIDLGTSHTVAVVRRGDEAPRPLLFDGSPVMPSAIFSEPPRLHVGRDAERMALTDPSRYEPHPKRRVDEGSVLLGNSEVTVVDMFVALLRRVAAEANQAGVPVGGGAVLTCPADWGAHRRRALMTAATAAGLGAVQIVDEPVAAATYCLDVLRQQVPVGGVVAVFDFGGGTLDASVLRREPGGLRVLSVGGLDDLGGVDVDAALVGHLGQLIGLRSPRVWQRLTNPGPQSEQRERRQFWDEVRAAKEMLSRASSAPVHVPGMDSALHLTRDELERIAGPLVDRAVDETRRVVRASGVDPAALSGLFLVGGSSRIPLVASRLHTRFGISPTVPEQPELPVAYGGLLAAGGARGGAGAGASGGPASARVPAQGRPPGMAPAGSPQGFASPPMTAPPMTAPPMSAPQSGPPSGPQPVQVPSGPVGGFPISSPPGSYAPGSGGPTPGAPSVGQSSGPPSYPSFQASATMPPVPPPGPPMTGLPMTGPPGMTGPGRPPTGPPRRRGTVRYFVVAVVVILVAACGGTGVWAFNSLSNAFNDTIDGSGERGGTAAAGEAGDLTEVKRVKVAGNGAVTVAAGPNGAYYASVAAGKLTVGAYSAAGAQRWEQTYDVEPTDVRIQPTGTLLVVDAEDAATHAGKPVRLVLDEATGAQKRLDPVENQRVVAYLGNDVLVESGQTAKPGAVQRIDLVTGTVKWTAQTKSYTSGLEPTTVRPTVVYAANGPAAGQGIATTVREVGDFTTGTDWGEAVAVDGAGFVVLDDTNGKATVLDANGKAKVSGAAVPLRSSGWAIYQGVVVGQLNDKASPGRVTIAGFGVNNLAQRWSYPLAAGANVRRIKPCGPTHMCVHYSLNSAYLIKSIDLSTGNLTWGEDLNTSSQPDWYLLGGGFVVGEWRFGNLSKPELRDPTTAAPVRGLSADRTFDSAIAGSGRWVLITGFKVSGVRTASTVVAVDITTGKATSILELGSSSFQVESAAVSGDVVVMIGKDHTLVIARAPAPK